MFGIVEILLLIALVASVAVVFYLFRPSGNGKKSEKPVTTGPPVKTPAKSSGSTKTRMSIFFGSQSGTAESFAQDLADEAKSHGYDAEAIDLETYEKDDLQNEKFAVFLMATFGEGEPTDNAAEFFEWLLNSEREEGSMTEVTFAVFALGNRQYEHFCTIGKRVDKQLSKLGATRLVDVGEGDDDGTLEEDYSEWKAKFWQAARSKFGLGPSDDDGKVPVWNPAWNINWTKFDKDKEEEAKSSKTQTLHSKYRWGLDGFRGDPKHKTEHALVVENRELRDDISDGGSTRHLELDIKDLFLTYVTADNLGVYPRNDYKLAGKLAERLGVNQKDLFNLKLKDTGSSRRHHFPTTCSVIDALLWYVDWNSLCKIKTLMHFAHFAEDEKEKAQLIRYGTEEKEKFAEEKRSIYEVLQDFPSINIPFNAFLELVPRIQPRFYTISSSSKETPNRIAITVSLTVTPLTRGRVHKGLCSNYLCETRENKDKICIFVRPSAFRLPKLKITPIVMIGPGTGVAPFRAFLRESIHFHKEKKDDVKLGDWHLFFGCRHRDKDYIYKDELEGAGDQKILKRLDVAFSRMTDKKVYVQHRLAEAGVELWDHVNKDKGYFYVCGGTAMGRDVRNALTTIIQNFGKLSADEAAAYVQEMQKKGRYIQELWS